MPLMEHYCLVGPEQCKIHEKRMVGATVSITLWPAGKLKGSTQEERRPWVPVEKRYEDRSVPRVRQTKER
jgi:hypothetical protein